MKFDFTYYNPTRIHFGKNALKHLSEELEGYGKTVLLVYGKGSVKRADCMIESFRLWWIAARRL